MRPGHKSSGRFEKRLKTDTEVKAVLEAIQSSVAKIREEIRPARRALGARLRQLLQTGWR